MRLVLTNAVGRPPAGLFLHTRDVAGLANIMAKAEQLGLFGNKPREEVKQPGSRGGKYWIDRSGKVRYGGQPHPSMHQTKDAPFFDTEAEATAAAKEYGPISQRDKPTPHVAEQRAADIKAGKQFKLDPPELGETRSGETVPHPHDPQAHEKGRYHAGALHFRNYSREDHEDAAKMHELYRRYHEQRNPALAAEHAHATAEHERRMKPASRPKTEAEPWYVVYRPDGTMKAAGPPEHAARHTAPGDKVVRGTRSEARGFVWDGKPSTTVGETSPKERARKTTHAIHFYPERTDSNSLIGIPKSIPSGAAVELTPYGNTVATHGPKRGKPSGRVLVSTKYEGRTWYAWVNQDSLEGGGKVTR